MVRVAGMERRFVNLRPDENLSPVNGLDDGIRTCYVHRQVFNYLVELYTCSAKTRHGNSSARLAAVEFARENRVVSFNRYAWIQREHAQQHAPAR